MRSFRPFGRRTAFAAAIIAGVVSLGQAASFGNLVGMTAGAGPADFTLNTNGSGTPPSIVGNVLTLTTAGQTVQAESAIFNTVLSVNLFTAQFTYTGTPGGADPGDGATFVIENDSRGIHALGGTGDGLGYAIDSNPSAAHSTPISPSVAAALNLYTGNPQTPGAQFAQNGTINLLGYGSIAPINIDSGDPIQFTLTYDGTTLRAHLEDLTTLAVDDGSEVINIPGIVGGSNAFIGFTGGDGGATSTQQISNFSFSNSIATPSVPLPAAAYSALPLLAGLGLAGFARRWPASVA